jgi:hypothetical protein
MVEENPTAKAVEPEAARKDWAEVADDDEEAGDQVIGQESAVEEKVAVAVSKKPAGPRPTKNKYGDFVVTKIAVRDPRDKAGKEHKKADDESSGEEEESEEEESEEEPEEKPAEVAEEPKKSKLFSHVFATSVTLCRGAC